MPGRVLIEIRPLLHSTPLHSTLHIHFLLYFISRQIYVVGAGSEATEIGCCGLGPQESGTGCQHWHDMINNARKPTAMWHYIR